MKTSSLTWRWKALSHKQILLGRTTHAVSHARRCASEASGAPQRPDRRKSALSIKQTPSSTPGAATPRARQAASLRPHVRLANGAAVVVILFTRCYHRGQRGLRLRTRRSWRRQRGNNSHVLSKLDRRSSGLGGSVRRKRRRAGLGRLEVSGFQRAV